MSRTKRGGKAPDYDYGSKRPFNEGYGTSPSDDNTMVKRRVAKAERRLGQKQIKEELK